MQTRKLFRGRNLSETFSDEKPESRKWMVDVESRKRWSAGLHPALADYGVPSGESKKGENRWQLRSYKGEEAMKAIRVHEFGDPEVLRLEEAPKSRPGPGQVLVRRDSARRRTFHFGATETAST